LPDPCRRGPPQYGPPLIVEPDERAKQFTNRSRVAGRAGGKRLIHGWKTGKRTNPQLTSVRSLAQALGLRPHEQDDLPGG
jgi:hypothetical protein